MEGGTTCTALIHDLQHMHASFWSPHIFISRSQPQPFPVEARAAVYFQSNDNERHVQAALLCDLFNSRTINTLK